MDERIIALDVGGRRIGIAVSDPLGITAQPVETYTRVGYGPDVRHIAGLAGQYGTRHILCGLPRNMDGSEGFQAEKVRQFAQKLSEEGFFISYYDERMTTVMAENALLEADMGRLNRKKKVDMVAAVMILQAFLDARKASEQRGGNAGKDEAGHDQDGLEADESDEQPEAAEESGEDMREGDLLEMEDEEGRIIPFQLSARIPYEGKEYVLLVSMQSVGELEKDESVLMLHTADAQGNPCYQSLEDEALMERVYDAYLRQSGG